MHCAGRRVSRPVWMDLSKGVDTPSALQRRVYKGATCQQRVKLHHDASLVCILLCVVTQVVAKKDVTHLVCQLPKLTTDRTSPRTGPFIGPRGIASLGTELRKVVWKRLKSGNTDLREMKETFCPETISAAGFVFPVLFPRKHRWAFAPYFFWTENKELSFVTLWSVRREASK